MPTFEQEIPPVTIQSLDNGRVLSVEEAIFISLTFDLESVFPDRMVIELQSEAGEILFSEELGPDEINLLPQPIILPEEIEPDRYILSVLVFQEGEIIAERQSVFFFGCGCL